MVQTLALDETNDIFLKDGGLLSLESGEKAVLHACANAAKAQLGEMVYAVNKGMPNFQTIWGGNKNISLFEAYLRKTLQQVPGVVSVPLIETSASGNVLSYKATIKTEYGKAAIYGG